MKNTLSHPRSAAFTGFLLCLPFVLIVTLLLLNIEPDFGILQNLLARQDPDQPDRLGSLIALGAFLLVIAAFVINFKQMVATLRRGNKVTAHPANLILTVGTLLFIVMVVSGFIVDQYPCWIGIHNCD